jgi:hypothetical protein
MQIYLMQHRMATNVTPQVHRTSPTVLLNLIQQTCSGPSRQCTQKVSVNQRAISRACNYLFIARTKNVCTATQPHSIRVFFTCGHETSHITSSLSFQKSSPTLYAPSISHAKDSGFISDTADDLENKSDEHIFQQLYSRN